MEAKVTGGTYGAPARISTIACPPPASGVHAGAYVVDAKTGKIIWKLNREDDPRWEHAHVGWASDIWDGSPGMEMEGTAPETYAVIAFGPDGQKVFARYKGANELRV